jgi:hypothetical protein
LSFGIRPAFRSIFLNPAEFKKDAASIGAVIDILFSN